MTIRVAVVEDHLLVLQTVSASLDKHPDINVVATDTGQADLLQLAREARPDVVVLDVSVRMRVDPVTTVEALRRTCPETKILALVSRDDAIFVRGLIEAGVRGCLHKSDEQILCLDEVVCRISNGGRVYSQEIMERYFDLPNVALTPQEMAILRLAAEGLSNGAIAERLAIASSTVRNCLSVIYAKLGTSQEAGVNPRVVAINKARQLGVL